MANNRREAIHNPIGDTAKRLARAYEKLGVSDQERLIPYHMSSVYWRFMEMLDTGANANMIKKEMVKFVINVLLCSVAETGTDICEFSIVVSEFSTN